MTDLQDLFRQSVERTDEQRRRTEQRDSSGVHALDELIAEWNATHPLPETPPPDESLPTEAESLAGRLRANRMHLAERIGSFPDHSVEIPAPLDEYALNEETGEWELIRPATRRERRRAQKEIDRLEKDFSQGKVVIPDIGDLDELQPMVTILGPTEGGTARLEDSPFRDLTQPLADPFDDDDADLDTLREPDLEPEPVPVPVVSLRSVPVRPTSPPSRDQEIKWASDTSDDAVRTNRDPYAVPTIQEKSEVKASVRAPADTRPRLLSRSVLTWSFIFLVAGLCFGASGAFWWSHFNEQVDGLRAETRQFTDQVETASSAIESQRSEAIESIDGALEVFTRIAGAPEVVILAGNLSESVWFVETRDESGAPSVGTAWVVSSTSSETLLVTSLSTVAASTAEPGPGITISGSDVVHEAVLWNWDETLDLALLRVEVGDLPPLPWAEEADASQALGSSIAIVGGLGGNGATAVPGMVVDQSQAGIQHTAPVGVAYQGGPIVIGSGRVLAIASLAYQPLGFDPGEVRFAVPVARLCETLLVCSSGAPPIPAPVDEEVVPG